MGQREGETGLTTHAPQAAQTVTLPVSLDEAVAALAAMPAAVPVAGGTDLMTSVNSGQLRPAALVGLGRISEIRGWQYQDGHALLGAGLTHARMGRPDFAALIPALAAAARAAAHRRSVTRAPWAATSPRPPLRGTRFRYWPPWRRR